MTTLTRHLKFQPHGDRLLTPSASFWLFAVRILVFAMASAEALAWGYLGYLFGEGAVRYFSAAFVGTVIFLIVWMIDASLVTLDRSWHEHAKAVLGDEIIGKQRKLRDAATVGLRIALVLGSLTITAPYLAALVFHRDIDREISTAAARQIENARATIKHGLDEEVGDKARELSSKRRQYEMEIAGRGPSRRYGSGPAAAAMGASATKVERELLALEERRKLALGSFDALSAQWRERRDELAAAYNLVLPSQSILENTRILEALRQRPENQSTERAIKAFLLFIFLGLLLLKLFEPSSVRLYLSDVLQQEYNRYLAGSFDSALPSTESSANPSAMSAQRFYDFLSKVWTPARIREREEARSRAADVQAHQDLDLLEKMTLHAERECAQREAEADRVGKLVDEAQQSLTELEAAIKAVSADVQGMNAELDLIPDLQMDERGRHEYRAFMTTKLTQAARALRELHETLPIETQRLERASAAAQTAELHLRDSRTELDQRRKESSALRAAVSHHAGERAKTALASA